MSNVQLENMNSQEAEEALAEALGLSTEELAKLNYGDIEVEEGEEGDLVRKYIEIFRAWSSEDVLGKVMKNVDYDDHDEYIIAYVENQLPSQKN